MCLRKSIGKDAPARRVRKERVTAMNNISEISQNADVIIVGTGAAGLFCALKLPETLNVRMITKDKAENSDSFLAQGGIATLRSPDDYEDYFEDTLKAGHYMNSKDSVKVMIESSPQIIKELLQYGVDFEQNEKGFTFTKEGGHSQPRILHHKDITGQEITSKLLEHVKQRKNIQIEEYVTMIDIISEENRCEGIIVEHKEKEVYGMNAKTIILATGGLGGLFQHSTNFKHITGDSLAIAIKHGIELQDVNFIQIHPTSFYSNDSGRSFLISEAVRGEGAVLLNSKMERFVDELQPRDVVTAAIKKQMDLDGTEFVYLSLRHMEEAKIKNRFPNIYEHCLEEGYNLATDCIPVTPAQHYFMGGIKVDLEGKTSMKNLYAIGETSCNGVHGKNRLGSNSLLESLVFSKRAAAAVVKEISSVEVVGASLDLNYICDRERPIKYKKLIFNEIKRRDNTFYEQWCSNESKYR